MPKPSTQMKNNLDDLKFYRQIHIMKYSRKLKSADLQAQKKRLIVVYYGGTK